MLRSTQSSIVSASKVDDNNIVGGGAINGGAVSWLNASKKLAKSKSRMKSGNLGNSNDLHKPKFLISKAK